MVQNIPLMEGQKFNRLTVIKLDHVEDRICNSKYEKSGKRKLHLEYYLCMCDCGKTTVVEKSHLRKKVGATGSCGCISGTHHLSHKNRIYNIWTGIRKRCIGCKTTDPNYKNYKGRGIKMCKEWEKDFVSFYNWALKSGYKEDLTIERINNDGNYEPSNCKWATKEEQAKNRRSVFKLEYNGKEMFLSDIAKKTGIKHLTILNRYHKYGICDKVFSKKNLKTGELL